MQRDEHWIEILLVIGVFLVALHDCWAGIKAGLGW